MDYFREQADKPCYSKTCLKRHLNLDKPKVLMENGRIMKVGSIAE